MKRKTSRQELNEGERTLLKLKDFYLTRPARRIEILRLLDGLIENLTDADLKDFFIVFRDYLLELAKPVEPAATDLERLEQSKDDHSEFFESVENHRRETVSDLERMMKEDSDA